MFPRGRKSDVGITLLCHRQIDSGGSKIHQGITSVQGKIVKGLGTKFGHGLVVGGVNPAGATDTGRLVDAIHLVLMAQPVCHHIKLQGSHRSEDKLVTVQWPEYLGGPFLG